jgi:hypothetical protein
LEPSLLRIATDERLWEQQRKRSQSLVWKSFWVRGLLSGSNRELNGMT